MKYLIPITLFLIAAAPSALAQHNCLEGFRYVRVYFRRRLAVAGWGSEN
jgi:hypothetical protein